MKGFIVLAVLACSIAASAGAQTLPRIQNSGVLNIGFIPDQLPFSSLRAGGRPDGYAIDLCLNVVQQVRDRLALPSIKVNYVEVAPVQAAALIEDGKIDLLCGAVPVTLGARAHVSFSMPIYFSGIGVLVRRDASPALLRVLNGQVAHTGPTWRATVNAGLANNTYVVYAGTATEKWVRERLVDLGAIAKVVAVNTHAAGVDMVQQGQADAFFADRAVLVTELSKRQGGATNLTVLDRRFTLQPIALAMARGDEDFRLAVDTALSKLYRSGDYLQLYVPRFGEPGELGRMLFQAYALPETLPTATP